MPGLGHQTCPLRQCAAPNAARLVHMRRRLIAARERRPSPSAAAAAGGAAGGAAAEAQAAKAPSPTPSPSQTPSRAAAAFASLAAAAGADVSGVVLCDSGAAAAGRRLVAARDAERGDILLAVPRSACIVVDYASDEGMSVPAGGAWPRLRQGVGFREPLTWDLLHALALMDAAAGDGGALWAEYADALLPAPAELTLPLCWGDALLAELRHAEAADAARAQRERLHSLFPGLAAPSGARAPSWLQWAFACVRSRAFKVGAEAWATVPFLDMDPNADFLPTSGNGGTTAGGAAAGGSGPAYCLVATKAVRAGDEVAVSYTGPGGATNRSLMARYGFVPAGGNPFDRLELQDVDGAGGSGVALSLDRAESVLGSGLLVDAARGRNPYLFAALKSLPFAPADGGNDGGSSDGSSAQLSTGSEAVAEARAAAALLAQVDAQLAGQAALEDDKRALEAAEAALARLQEQQQQQQQQGVGQAGGREEEERQGGEEEEAEADLARCDALRAAAALRYRVERQRLLRAARAVLSGYVRSAEASAAGGGASAGG